MSRRRNNFPHLHINSEIFTLILDNLSYCMTMNMIPAKFPSFFIFMKCKVDEKIHGPEI